jgi:hypothetical protein
MMSPLVQSGVAFAAICGKKQLAPRRVEMNRIQRLLTTISVMAAMFLLASCGPSKSELKARLQRAQDVAAAKDHALSLVKVACSATEVSGDNASALRDHADDGLRQFGLSVESLPVDVNRCIADGYYRQAGGLIHALRYPNKKESRTPEELRSEFYRTQQASGRNLTAFNATSTGIDRLVGKFHLALAGKESKGYSISEYKRAGLKPNVIVKKRTTIASAKRHHRRTTQ